MCAIRRCVSLAASDMSRETEAMIYGLAATLIVAVIMGAIMSGCIK